MDEVAERAKLQLLDLTEDVIELILEKKRKTYASRIPVQDVVPEIDDKELRSSTEQIPADQVEEPTYYPPVETIVCPTGEHSSAQTHQSIIPHLNTFSKWGWFSKRVSFHK